MVVEIDWARRHRHMRMHTCLHLLCAVVPAGVTGGQVGDALGEFLLLARLHPLETIQQRENVIPNATADGHLAGNR